MRVSRSSKTTAPFAARIQARIKARVEARPSVTAFWSGQSLGQRFADTVRSRPEATMLIEERESFRFRDIEQESRRLAAGLAARGTCPGDAIAYQLPNWREAVVIFLAGTRLGAHLVPLVPLLGTRELRQIFLETSPRFVFVNGETDQATETRPDLRASQSHQPRVISVRSGTEGPDTYAALLRPEESAPLPEVDPQTAAAVIYTSGSTAAPKGALHIHETLAAEIDSLRAAHTLGPADRVLMPSSLGHISGIIHGILAPALLGTSAVLQPRWDARAALEAIDQSAVTYMIGAPVFLQEMLARPELQQRDLATLRLFSCGGAPVSPALLAEARQKLPNLTAKRVYGSSEFPTISTTDASDAGERGQDSEGKPLRGVAIRITDAAGIELPPGTEGEIRARGPECFLGYAAASQDDGVFDAEDFLRTGDLGIVDADGYLRISGRLKDIIVRKGENISAREIEEQILACCEEFLEVVVIALPDSARGEIACACGRYVPGAAPLTLPRLVTRLRKSGLSTRKIPERLENIDHFPRTPSGKVDKRQLVRLLQESTPAPLAGGDLRG